MIINFISQINILGEVGEGKLMRDLVPGFLLGAGQFSMFQNSRPQEGKYMFRINHIVCINSLGTGSRSYQGMVGTLLKFKF